ncbi:flagellar hook-length control protein FliK [Alteromonas stellipolaris]|uniref:flagellar hook-length control protein FliK n=1 Tax=Alteromonas stellipolaris TaxID=233316 RepID=UPI0026E2CB53|nr:flagellar hook-length control protein FliK [Alteromonas stellipolaris]MDO6534213.1 flagellar hook-length control protein FliK [Alteromonas stellipolaris]MDO6624433.1 flagellar hook-length control protein FliK [Alteromonas stellipolaris]
MTSQLSALLSNITQNTSGSKSSAASVLNNLSQAAALDTAAKVTVARLPEQILAIQTQGQPATQVSLLKSADLLPPQRPQLISFSQNGGTQAALISTETGMSTSQVTAMQLKTLSLSLATMLASMPTPQQNMRVNVQATVTQLTNNQLSLSLADGQQLNLQLKPDAAAQLSGDIKNNGKLVSLSLNQVPGDTGKLAVAITSSKQTNLAAQGAQSAASTLQAAPLSITDSKVSAVITNALRFQGIAFGHGNLGNANVPDTIAKQLPNIQTQNTLQQVSMLSLKGNTLTSYSAASQAVLKFPSPEGGTVIPRASEQLTAKLSASAIPVGAMVGKGVGQEVGRTAVSNSVITDATAKTSANGSDNLVQRAKADNANQASSSPSIKSSPEFSTAVDGKSALIQGTDVHKAIITLSRALLSQTGSTQQALTQLTAILNGTVEGSDKTTAVLNQIAKQITGINSNALPSAKPLSSPQPANTTTTSASSNSSQESIASTNDDTAGIKKGAGDINTGNADTSLRKGISQLIALLGGSGNGIRGNATQGNNIGFPSNTAPSSDKAATQATSLQDGDKNGLETKSSTPNTQHNTQATQNNADASIASRIHALINAPAIAVTPLTLTSPIAASNFVQGLVALLQLSLAGRALSKQPSLKAQIDSPDSIISKTITNTSGTVLSSRVAQDVANLDSRTNLLANLKTLLANHQHSKVAQAETRVQGQDSFFYALPSVTQHYAPAELLVQREPDRQHEKEGKDGDRRLWNVTMKLDIGDAGQLLAKSKIDTDTITIDLYTSNETVLTRVADTLPFLERRLADLGLNVEKMSFQRGHIPETLNKRPHQIFETRV